MRDAVLSLELVNPPEHVDAGAGFVLTLALDCDTICDLSQLRYVVRCEEACVGQGLFGTIIRFDPSASDYDPRNGPVETRDQVVLQMQAPQALTAFEWRLEVPAQIIDDVHVAQTELIFAATTTTHQTSLAVWDVPAPVLAGEKMRVSVGAKCSAGCHLAGLTLHVIREDGVTVASGILRAPHPEVEGLWCGEIEMTVPDQIGPVAYDIRFAPGDTRGLPHETAEASFNTMVDAPPDHAVAVSIIDSVTGVPVDEAHVRLGLRRISTDSSGRVVIPVPRGEHRLFIWKAGFEIPEQIVRVDHDLDVIVQAKALPEKNPYERWQG